MKRPQKLRTRKPTGQVAWPLVLVEGQEKTGKTYSALRLSADERIGRAFLFDVAEGSGDEYGPLGDFEIVELDGTYTDFIGQLEAATSIPARDDRPNLIVIDSITGLWDGLKVWTENRARNSRRGRKILAEDPDAAVDISMNLWTDANTRWGHMIHLLRAWPGIAVLIARGRETAKVDKDGRPISGETDYRVDAQKDTPYNVTAQVRMTKPHAATLVSVRSLTVDLPPRGLELPDKDPLAHLIFDILGAGGEGFTIPDIVPASFGRTVIDAKNELVAFFEQAGHPTPTATDAAKAIWANGPCPDASGGDDITEADWKALTDAAALALEEAVA